MIGMCDIPPRGLKMASSFIGNTTAIKEVVERIFKQFTLMKSRRAFFHWYTNEGIEEDDFGQVETGLIDLIAEFKNKETLTNKEGAGEGGMGGEWAGLAAHVDAVGGDDGDGEGEGEEVAGAYVAAIGADADAGGGGVGGGRDGWGGRAKEKNEEGALHSGEVGSIWWRRWESAAAWEARPRRSSHSARDLRATADSRIDRERVWEAMAALKSARLASMTPR